MIQFFKKSTQSALTTCYLLILIIFVNNNSYSRQVNVNRISSLQNAINNAFVNDTIILANGTYTTNNIIIGSNNITVVPATLGGVFLNGYDSIVISGSHVVFSGFQFISGSMSGAVISVTGDYNTLSQLNFNGYVSSKFIKISGHNNTISNSNFENKSGTAPIGVLIQVDASATTVGYNVIRYCSFKHIYGTGGDYGNECIRIGESSMSTFVSRTVIEYCYFEDTGYGDSESISVKSQENCLRYNTMNNNPNAMFSFRNGDNNIAYGNFFLRSGGIRCKQANNIYCYNNYFEKSGTGIDPNIPGNGGRSVVLEYYGTGYGNNINLYHNTFYKCNSIELQNGITNNTWANNIFYQDSFKIFNSSSTGSIYKSNLYQGTIGTTISSGMIQANPLLTLNSDGYYGLSAGSPAIDASSTIYTSPLGIVGIGADSTIAFDIQGQARPSQKNLKDIGCDEYQSGILLNHPVSACNTGPNYEIISAANGDWNTPSTWVGGVVPSCNNKVVVRHNVTLSTDASCYSIRIETVNGSLLVNQNHTLSVLH